jgi:glucosamine 6-phosphate synthetase-like amidotransferase/phosphosugar isomerase protein
VEGNIICGLVGCAGKILAAHENALKQLLIVDSLRGAHSTGVASVSNSWDVSLVKEPTLPHYLFGTKEFRDAFLKMNKVIIGHNRFATQGAINKDNAHPYEFQHIVGAHNGTLTSMHRLPEHKGFEVDSQALLYSINVHGSEAVADKIHGAFALTWYDKRDKTLHFWRNNQRPLWICYLENKDTIFWASEKGMLEFVLDRNNLKHEGMFELPIDNEYIYSVDAVNNLSESLMVAKRDSYTPPVYSGNYGKYRVNYNNWDDWYEKADSKHSPKKPLALVINNDSKGNQQSKGNLPVVSSQPENSLRSKLRRLSDLLLSAL